VQDKFYSHDGTWRTAEPSWRYLISKKQNVCGSTNALFPLHDPASDFSSSGVQLGHRHIRGPEPIEPPTSAAASTPARPSYDLQDSASRAAYSLCTLSLKDQKRSGFMNETLVHTDPFEPSDRQRWGRLGIMTRERMTGTDKFGDIDIPQQPPHAHEGPLRPAPAEKTGFTRGAATHGMSFCTGGFVYVEPERAPTAAVHPYALPERIAGRKCATGFAINNEHDGPAPPVDAESHYMRTGIGHPGASSKVDKYGDLKARTPSVLETAAERVLGGAVETLKMEESGFTRTKAAKSVGAVPNLGRAPTERDLHPTQIRLRKMADPVEHTDPHAHKMRAARH